MHRRSSSLLSRLALALLAVLGFVAPLAVHERDRVEQTCSAPPVEVVATPRSPRSASRVCATPRAGPMVRADAELRVSPKYLLHRAWLL